MPRLSLLCHDARLSRPIRAAAAHWSAREGVEFAVTVHPAPVSGDYDLVLTDPPTVAGGAAAGRFAPLDDLIGGLDLLAMDALAGCADAFSWAGARWAVPAAVCFPVAARAHRRFAADRLPATWAEVATLARGGGVALALHGTDAFDTALTLSTSLSAGGVGRPADDITEEAIRWLADVVPHLDPRCFDLDGLSVLAWMAGGGPVYAPVIRGHPEFQKADRLRFADLPGPEHRGSVVSCTGLAVVAAGSDLHEAARFAAWFTGPGQVSQVVPNGGQPAAGSAWCLRRADEAANGYLSAVRATAVRGSVPPRTPWWSAYRERAGARLSVLLRAGIGDAGDERTQPDPRAVCRPGHHATLTGRPRPGLGSPQSIHPWYAWGGGPNTARPRLRGSLKHVSVGGRVGVCSAEVRGVRPAARQLAASDGEIEPTLRDVDGLSCDDSGLNVGGRRAKIGLLEPATVAGVTQCLGLVAGAGLADGE